MITEFTCGIYTAVFNEIAGDKWYIKTNNHMVAMIEPDGLLIKWLSSCPLLTDSDMIEIVVLMTNIKRQYKQLQTA